MFKLKPSYYFWFKPECLRAASILGGIRWMLTQALLPFHLFELQYLGKPVTRLTYAKIEVAHSSEST